MDLKTAFVTALSFIRQPRKRRLISAALRLRSKKGIEIGGPSAFFGLRGGCPVYLFADRVDGVNFSHETFWEGSIKEGETYQYFNGKIGHQYIAEATDLQNIPSSSYDFLLSCHSLEHVANPIKALMEWKRVMKTGARLILILPDKRKTFDINRPYSTLEHLVEDYHNNTGENDQTHMEEIIQNHDPAYDPEHKTRDQLRALLEQNFEKRLSHHHVFSQQLVKQVLEYCGFDVLFQQEADPFHLVTVAVKK